jgi:protein phosphatase 1L
MDSVVNGAVGLLPGVWAVMAKGKRDSMEDRFVAVTRREGHFYGVFDGHGGAEAADIASRRLHDAFFANLGTDAAIEVSLSIAFASVDSELDFQYRGTTATAVFHAADRLTVANVGDGRAFLVTQAGRTRQLTTDHTLNSAEESARIAQRGGLLSGPYVMVSDRGLMVTRALGDKAFRSVGVVPVPSIVTLNLASSDMWLVLATDGFWGSLGAETVGDILSSTLLLADACEEMLRIVADSEDNATALISRLFV